MKRYIATALASAIAAAALAAAGTLAVLDHQADTAERDFRQACTAGEGRIRTLFPRDVVAAYEDGNRVALASSELVTFCVAPESYEG